MRFEFDHIFDFRRPEADKYRTKASEEFAAGRFLLRTSGGGLDGSSVPVVSVLIWSRLMTVST